MTKEEKYEILVELEKCFFEEEYRKLLMELAKRAHIPGVHCERCPLAETCMENKVSAMIYYWGYYPEVLSSMLYDCPIYAHLHQNWTYSDGIREDFPESAKRMDEWKEEDLWTGPHNEAVPRELVMEGVKHFLVEGSWHPSGLFCIEEF